ncbi:MAG: hypothetical protein ACRD0Y_11790 [Terriglobales bacterium]
MLQPNGPMPAAMPANELLERLTLYAYGLFGCYPHTASEPVLRASGKGPEDLAMDVLIRHLDPADARVRWEPSRGSLLSYLKTVLWHDFLDLKRGGLYRRTTADPESLPALPSREESQEARLVRAQQRTLVLEQLSAEPDLQALAAQQLDPDGWPGYTNQELAARLHTTVAEIENRKKRLLRRLLRLGRQPAVMAKG